MSYKDINIQACYESGIGDIVEDFYEPVLSTSIVYDRIAGFFSSSSLAIASRGLYGFIKNKGKMRLLTSPILNRDDADIIHKVIVAPETLTSIDLGINLSDICNEFVDNHVKALGWMLKMGVLEMKLAIVIDQEGNPCSEEEVKNSGLFHQKVGILRDVDGNELSFSGSINETASAWINNDEEFKVFKGWETSREYYLKDLARFSEIWNGKRQNVKVFDLPSAVKEDLIRKSSDFNLESISINRYRKAKFKAFDFKNSPISLFNYQAEALNKWKDNHYRLLFEMATGTGKTRTAIAGIQRILDTSKRVVVIVSTPQNTLSKQWKEKEVEPLGLRFNKNEIIDGTVNDWHKKLSQLLMENAIGLADHCIIFTTHNTASSDKFTSTVLKDLSKSTISLFVGDEVHWLGAKKFRKALLDIYNYRIGLSATPTRWFDDEGSKCILDYFGNDSYVFSIHDALTKINPLTGKHFLVNYFYHIKKVSLNDEETKSYKITTQKIIKLRKRIDSDNEAAEKYERLLEKRANIIKNAEAKYLVLNNILNELELNCNLEKIIIFVSPNQMTKVMEILYNKKIMFHKLTESEGTRSEIRYNGKSEREFIISKFKSGDYKILVAIKCLDEGIDIPSANIGILMASSTNPREYIQRIGRIIRQDKGKTFAHLFDICVNKVDGLDEEEEDLERMIKKKEAIRLIEIAENSINPTDAANEIMDLIY